MIASLQSYVLEKSWTIFAFDTRTRRARMTCTGDSVQYTYKKFAHNTMLYDISKANRAPVSNNLNYKNFILVFSKFAIVTIGIVV